VILLSPVVSLSPHLAKSAVPLVLTIGQLLPNQRISLRSLSRNQAIQVTQGASDHHAQSQTNAWHVESFTFRFLTSIANLIQQAPSLISQVQAPTLLIYGGMDFFSPPETLTSHLHTHSPKIDTYFVADAHHLILYDQNANEIFNKIQSWLNR